MNTELPIRIKISDELSEQLLSIKGICNKLEAQLNFQTLAAGWYENEDDILLITLFIQSPEDFAFQQTQTHLGQFTSFADDAFSYHEAEIKQLNCFVAITQSELTLLKQQEKITQGYLQKKIVKVVNLNAEQLSLLPIYQ